MRQTEFCRNRGLSWSTLQRHLKEQQRKHTGTKLPIQLLGVELANPNTPRNHGKRCGLTVMLPGGRRIEVEPGFDPHTLEQLVGTLERM